MLDYLIRLIVILLIITGVAFIIPTLVVFFLQILLASSVFLVVLYILSWFYNGDKDEVH